MTNNMKKAIIVHGMPSKTEYLISTNPAPSNAHRFPWLQKQLIMNDILAQTPEMPTPYEPRYEEWKSVFEQFQIDAETVLVGHSCGAGFLIRWLSENKIKVGPVMLVAPWIDPSHEDRNLIGDFFDFTINPTLSDRTHGVTIFISNDDDKSMLKSVEVLESTIKDHQTKRFEDKGHFTIGGMGTDEFPELLQEILKKSKLD